MKEIWGVLDRSDEIFALVMVGIILFLTVATFIANHWAKKHGFPNGKHEK